MEELSLVETLEEEFLAYIKKMEALEEALALVYWDLRTGAPSKGMEVALMLLAFYLKRFSICKHLKKWLLLLLDLTLIKKIYLKSLLKL